MIQSIQFPGGYPTKLQFGKKRIEFGPRLNIVLGYNGSGKSTLLKAMAADAGLCPPLECAKPIVMRDNEEIIYQDSHQANPLFNDQFFEKFDTLRSDGEIRMGLVNEWRHWLREKFPLYSTKFDKRLSLLLDEPDMHLSLPAQYYLWKNIFPMLSKQFQLIISSHSVFALLLKNQGIVSREDHLHLLSVGYDEEVIRSLGLAIDYYNRHSK